MSRAYDARERYLARRDRGARVEIVTPEGIALTWNVAGAGERLSALMIDLVIIFLVIMVVALGAMFALGSALTGWLSIFVQLALFLLANFYFAFFEIRWRGQTPGKRRVGLRVIDRNGGELGGQAVVARNLMRQLELFVPLGVLGAPETIWPGQPGWARAAAVIWLIVLVLLPLWNRERLRAGDLVAGTVVVVAPTAMLLADVGEQRGHGHDFTREQLEVYGIYELQVLEGLLRDFDDGKTDVAALEMVAAKIAKKIGWQGTMTYPNRFLADFYAAQRARLEQKLLFGKRREDKHG